MENLYATLGCEPKATYEELKQAYQKLVMTHHPDRVVNLSEADREFHAKRFIAIDKAWKVLGDRERRSQYDAVWHQRCLAQLWPIQDDVPFDDFEILQDEATQNMTESEGASATDDDPFTSENLNAYVYPCRCGGEYTLSPLDSSFKVDYVCCESCSLCIRIVYPLAQQ